MHVGQQLEAKQPIKTFLRPFLETDEFVAFLNHHKLEFLPDNLQARTVRIFRGNHYSANSGRTKVITAQNHY